jgi:hypothetical protein
MGYIYCVVDQLLSVHVKQVGEYLVNTVRAPAWNCIEPHARSLWNRPAVSTGDHAAATGVF